MRRVAAACLWALLLWSAAARATAFRDLDSDYRQGKIDVDGYFLARTLLALSPEQLAGTRFARLAEQAGRVRSGTVFVRDARARYHDLREETRGQLAFVVLRPTDVRGGIDSKRHILPQTYGTAHFVFHWTTGADGGSASDAPPLVDGDSSGVPDYIERFADYFEQSWSAVIGERGFRQPPSDGEIANDSYNRNPDGRYDVFVYNMQVYGYTQPDTSARTPPSFIGVDNDYAGFPSPQEEAMQVTASHEFCHACQFAYDAQEDGWWMEVTSTWMESEVFPDADDNFQYLPYWFSHSDTLGLTVFDGLHEYGSFIWAVRLSEDFSDDIIRQIWEGCASSSALPATESALAGRGVTLAEEFLRFAAANFFLEEMYLRGAQYRAYLVSRGVSGVRVEYRYTQSAGMPKLINDAVASYGCWMDRWAADYVAVDPSTLVPGYALFFNGLDTSGAYGVRTVLKDGAGFESFVCVLDGNKDGVMATPSSGFTAGVVILANLSGAAVADPAWELTVGSIPYRPVNIFPADGGVSGAASALVASSFSDADGGVHASSRWQVKNAADAVVWEETADAATATSVPAGILFPGEAYSWRVAYRDNTGAWSDWSEETTFTTAVIPGDLNADGLWTSADVVLCLRMAMGLSASVPAADLNGDDLATIADVVLLLRLSLGL